MAVIVDARDDIRYIRLTEAVDIAQAAELKSALIEAIMSSHRVCVQVASLTATDATIVQLLWAAVSHAKSAPSEFVLEGPLSDVLEKSLAGTGISPLLASLFAKPEAEAGHVLATRN